MSKVEFNPELFEEFKNDFTVEAVENLNRFNQDLLKIENKGVNPEVINFHLPYPANRKGSSGNLGLSKLESISHTGENQTLSFFSSDRK